MAAPPLRDRVTLGEAIALLRGINNLADAEQWSMVSVHLQMWSQVIARSAEQDAWLTKQGLEGLGK